MFSVIIIFSQFTAVNSSLLFSVGNCEDILKGTPVGVAKYALNLLLI
jgi:hypothetical protein